MIIILDMCNEAYIVYVLAIQKYWTCLSIAKTYIWLNGDTCNCV